MKLSIRRPLVATIACTTVLAGALTFTTAAPANAVRTVTNYGFQTSAYGTLAMAEQVGLRSNKTAFSYIGCTRLTGIKRTRLITAANAPANNPQLHVGAVESNSVTYKKWTSGAVGTRSNNRIAKVVLGDPTGVNITINGLRTIADAWATKDGKLHVKSSFSSVDISANTGTPLDDVLNQAGAGIGDLIEQLAAAVDHNLVIPGLGRVALGRTRNKVYSGFAQSNAVALRVTLFGPNSAEGGGDDTHVIIGRSRARITRNLPAGVMRGFAYGLDAQVAEGTLVVGRLAERPLPCQGTRGNILRSDAVGLDLANAGVVDVGAATARVYGIQNQDHSAKAWTEGRIASVQLGSGDTSLLIKGIVGRANVVQGKRGNIFKSIRGSSIAEFRIGGEIQTIPDPGQPIEIPGVAIVEFFVRDPDPRSIKVTAVRITLLGDSPLFTQINLGVAKAGIKKF